MAGFRPAFSCLVGIQPRGRTKPPDAEGGKKGRPTCRKALTCREWEGRGGRRASVRPVSVASCPSGQMSCRKGGHWWLWCHHHPWVSFPLSHVGAALCACVSAHRPASLRSLHVAPQCSPPLASPLSDVSSLLSLLHPWCSRSPAWRPPPRETSACLGVVIIIRPAFEHTSENYVVCDIVFCLLSPARWQESGGRVVALCFGCVFHFAKERHDWLSIRLSS